MEQPLILWSELKWKSWKLGMSWRIRIQCLVSNQQRENKRSNKTESFQKIARALWKKKREKVAKQKQGKMRLARQNDVNIHLRSCSRTLATLWVPFSPALLPSILPFQALLLGRWERREVRRKRTSIWLDYFLLTRGSELFGASVIFISRTSPFFSLHKMTWQIFSRLQHILVLLVQNSKHHTLAGTVCGWQNHGPPRAQGES